MESLYKRYTSKDGRSSGVSFKFDFQGQKVEIETTFDQLPDESFRAYGYSGAGTYTDRKTLEQLLNHPPAAFSVVEKEEQICWNRKRIEISFEGSFLAGWAAFFAENYALAQKEWTDAIGCEASKERLGFVKVCLEFIEKNDLK